MGDDLYSGYLVKRGHFRTNLKKRWFVLTPDRVKYFENENDDRILGDFKFTKETTVKIKDDAARGQYAFTISNVKGSKGGNSVEVFAETSSAMRQWKLGIEQEVSKIGALKVANTGRGTLVRGSTLGDVPQRRTSALNRISRMSGEDMVVANKTQDPLDFAQRLTGKDEPFYQWVTKKPSGFSVIQQQQRLLVVGDHFVYSARAKASGLQIQRQAHLYELDYYGHDPSNQQRLLLKFKEFELTIHELDSEGAQAVLEAIHHALVKITYQFPKDALARVPPRTLAMMDYVDVAVPPLQGHLAMYDAQCAKVGLMTGSEVQDVLTDALSQYDITVKPTEELAESMVLDLNACFPDLIDELAVRTLEPIVMFSKWFGTIYALKENMTAEASALLFEFVSKNDRVTRLKLKRDPGDEGHTGRESVLGRPVSTQYAPTPKPAEPAAPPPPPTVIVKEAPKNPLLDLLKDKNMTKEDLLALMALQEQQNSDLGSGGGDLGAAAAMMDISTPSDNPDIEMLRKQVQVLMATGNMSQSELQWKLDSAGKNACLVAEKKLKEAEDGYSSLMYNQSKLEKLAYLLKNPNVDRALKAAKKAKAPSDDDAGGGGGGGGLAALGGGGGGGKLPMAGPGGLAAALAKRQAGGADADAAPAKPDMGAMLGGALAKRQAAAAAEDDGAPAKPDIGAMLAKRPNPFGAGGPPGAGGPMGGGLGGALGGLKGGLGGLKKGGGGAATYEGARKKLQKEIKVSQKEVASLPPDQDFRIPIEAMQRVVDATDDRMNQVAAMVIESLETKLQETQSELKGIKAKAQKYEEDIELWRGRFTSAPEYNQVIASRLAIWEESEREENLRALKIMRSYIPVNIGDLSAKDLRDAAEEYGSMYTVDLSEYIKAKRLLWWVVMHPEDIAKANFLAGAHVGSFRDLGSYDVCELRAVYAAMPQTFEMDSTPGKVGLKANWRTGLAERLKSLIQQQRRETVPGGWDPIQNCPQQVQLPPLEDRLKRNPIYFFHCQEAMKVRKEKFEFMKNKLAEKKARLAELEGGLLDESRAERDAIFADSRNEYLQEQYGKEVIKKLRDDASSAYDALVKEAKTLTTEIKSLENNLANATPTSEEFEDECGKIEEDELQVPDSAADADYVVEVVIGEEEEGDGRELAGRLEDWYCRFADSSKRGRMVPGPFDPDPEIKKIQRAVMKKLTDAEEAALRKKEMAELKAKQEKAKAERMAQQKAQMEGGATSNIRSNVMKSRPSKPKKEVVAVAPKSKALAALLAGAGGGAGGGGPGGRDSPGSGGVGGGRDSPGFRGSSGTIDSPSRNSTYGNTFGGSPKAFSTMNPALSKRLLENVASFRGSGASSSGLSPGALEKARGASSRRALAAADGGSMSGLSPGALEKARGASSRRKMETADGGSGVPSRQTGRQF